MFKKKNCQKCNEKINKKSNFCPNCGFKLKETKKEDWGLLGKNDSIKEENFQTPFFGGFSGKILNNMIGSAMKMLEKELQKENLNQEKGYNSNFKLMINGKEIKFNKNQESKNPKKEAIIPSTFDIEKIRKFRELEKKEPKTNLKRIGDKIIYEIEMPEIKSFKDILINHLENSIEIKAIGKTKAYFKIIPINIPILNKKLIKGKLILELKEE